MVKGLFILGHNTSANHIAEAEGETACVQIQWRPLPFQNVLLRGISWLKAAHQDINRNLRFRIQKMNKTQLLHLTAFIQLLHINLYIVLIILYPALDCNCKSIVQYTINSLISLITINYDININYNIKTPIFFCCKKYFLSKQTK